MAFQKRDEIRFGQYLGRAEQFEQILIDLDKLQPCIEKTDTYAADVLWYFIVPLSIFLQPPPLRACKFHTEFLHQSNDFTSPVDNPFRQEGIDFF
mmetsp:Transcript_8994/g.29987  ORF Transcript_8994/g.29987 Transcript_8994/m.29987 type:complete len:95 (-) Transcript_8994:156-440(-)